MRKLKSRSAQAPEQMVSAGEAFNLIYIDADHAHDAVLIDSFLAWKLLKPGGILLWDDYKWNHGKPLKMRPQQAIDVFLPLHGQELEKLHLGYQVCVKRKAAPAN